ncbi:hypothetical protein BKA67DRAFT_28447 [Truncatella angustata]|uniref:Uncharacterized protein n=1 Tax=Truncatella angustata TaxID=152316 RepID=A0A9P8UX36_9PEZI|nr:uncharacterized protein BKA67DRAFT_28447 [Truncatella angustata]KAH6659775.1 hypothetical protein BKA67DRAFT_28447 [Truncatella angustata]KAH8203112.1 hypothetical protein TruAng_002745 [Truncatella angustata]
MSVLSIMKKGRQQAKEQNAKDMEKAKQETAKAAYKHVPTHAGTDALSGAPAGSNLDYRSRIREQNRKRNSMTAVETRPGTLPRVSSSLSNVSYPSTSASPVVPVSRVHSFNSLPPTWQHMSPGNSVARDDFSHSNSRKGKERELIPPVPPLPPFTQSMLGVGGRTRVKPNGSSGNSSSSEEDLEVGHKRPVSYNYSTPGNTSGSALSVSGSPRNPVTSAASHHFPQSHQRTMSAQSISRAHRFAAPRPMNHAALSIPGSPPAYPVPPISSIDSVSSSPAMSNSYASSARSKGSSAPSSAATTPAASVIAAFPSADKLPSLSLDQSAKHRMDTVKQRGPAVEIEAPNEMKKKRWSFLTSKRQAATTA